MNESRAGGWLAFLAALGIMSGLMVEDIRALTNWGEVLSPPFVANILAHFAATVLAFLGGKVLPTHRGDDTKTRTRDTDPNSKRTDL